MPRICKIRVSFTIDKIALYELPESKRVTLDKLDSRIADIIDEEWQWLNDNDIEIEILDCEEVSEDESVA